MSLSLDQGSTPAGTLVKTFGVPREDGKRVICIGDEIEITHEDFCAVVEYFLTNEDIYADDPRLKLLKRLKQAEVSKGYAAKANGIRFNPGPSKLDTASLALKCIAEIGGNLPDDRLTDRTGPNDAKQRGLMYCGARQIANEALLKLKD